MKLLRKRGVGIEVGLASTEDADRFVSLPNHEHVFRILIELDNEKELDPALATYQRITAILDQANIQQSILLHGFNATVWPFVKLARKNRFATRVGFEDGKEMPDGIVAADNAALVSAAVSIYRA
jgi:uncharacterized protein (DUF849 family)